MCQKECPKICQKMPETMLGICQKMWQKCHNICQIECQKICQKNARKNVRDMSEDVPEEMSEHMPDTMPGFHYCNFLPGGPGRLPSASRRLGALTARQGARKGATTRKKTTSNSRSKRSPLDVNQDNGRRGEDIFDGTYRPSKFSSFPRPHQALSQKMSEHRTYM